MLPVVTRMAQALKVGHIERAAAVCYLNDVVDDLGKYDPSVSFALLAQGMMNPVPLPKTTPFRGVIELVPPRSRRVVFMLRPTLSFSDVFLSRLSRHSHTSLWYSTNAP